MTSKTISTDITRPVTLGSGSQASSSAIPTCGTVKRSKARKEGERIGPAP